MRKLVESDLSPTYLILYVYKMQQKLTELSILNKNVALQSSFINDNILLFFV